MSIQANEYIHIGRNEWNTWTNNNKVALATTAVVYRPALFVHIIQAARILFICGIKRHRIDSQFANNRFISILANIG